MRMANGVAPGARSTRCTLPITTKNGASPCTPIAACSRCYVSRGQAGLSWLTILRKRETYRRAFDDFDAEKMARYGDAKRKRLLLDAGIVRNRLKVDAFISNAQAYLKICERPGGFDKYIWQFTDGKVVRRRPLYLGGIPASTSQSDTMSKDLKQNGFRFVGTTICYAFMQAVGMVDEHQRYCWAGDRS